MLFETQTDVDSLVIEFEACTLSHDLWTHAAHVSVATAYAIRFGASAIDRMREGIQRLNASLGVEQTRTGGYHETLTVAWMRLVQAALAEALSEDGEWLRINFVVEALSDKKIVLNYYSRDAIMSPAARYGWLEPDLAVLPPNQ